MSYAQLIAEALLTGSERMLTLNDIYIAINKQHPYYSLDAASGRNWQNAIRLVKLLENILLGFLLVRDIKKTNLKYLEMSLKVHVF